MSPAIDKRLELDGFRIGETNRVRTVYADGAGKGINVALALRALSEPVACIGVLAGNGDMVTGRLARNAVPHAFVPVPGAVRVNLKLMDLSNGVITEVNEPAAPVPEALLDQAAAEAVRAAKDSRWLVLTGSLPAGCPPDFYAHIIRRAQSEAPACRVLLDADGERLKIGASAAPFAIKPNLAEMEEAAGKRLGTVAERLAAARAALAAGPELIALSMGAEGALVVSRQEAHFAPAIPADIVTTTGAGDAMVAGLLHGILREGTLSGALSHGIAAAAARCAYAGDRFIDPALHLANLKNVRLQKL